MPPHGLDASAPQDHDLVGVQDGRQAMGDDNGRGALDGAVDGLLDQPLDSESERLVQQAIDRAVQGATSIVIAHRLSTVARANLIVVLEAGRIAEVGTHDALLAAGGKYSAMVRLQTSSAFVP